MPLTWSPVGCSKTGLDGDKLLDQHHIKAFALTSILETTEPNGEVRAFIIIMERVEGFGLPAVSCTSAELGSNGEQNGKRERQQQNASGPAVASFRNSWIPPVTLQGTTPALALYKHAHEL